LNSLIFNEFVCNTFKYSRITSHNRYEKWKFFKKFSERLTNWLNRNISLIKYIRKRNIIHKNYNYGRKFSSVDSIPFGSCKPRNNSLMWLVFFLNYLVLPFFWANSNKVECRNDPSRWIWSWKIQNLSSVFNKSNRTSTNDGWI
jgi:hypothetical protein